MALTAALIPFVGAALAIVIYKTRPDRFENRTLGFIVLAETISVGSGVGFMYLTDSAATAYAWQIVTFVVGPPATAAYLLLLATLDTPLARPLRHPLGRFAMLAYAVAVPVWVLVAPEGAIAGLRPTWYSPWDVTWGARAQAWILFSAVIFVYAVVVAVSAWRRATPGTAARDRARLFALAFGLRDLFFIAFLGTLILGLDARWQDVLGLVGWPATYIVFMGLLAYAILQHQLLGIDLRLKIALSRGTVLAVFVAVFFAVSELAAAFFTDRTGSTIVGVLAAAGLLLILSPLQRLAERISDAALPHVRDTPEYHADRARDLYRAAIEGALEDGEITSRERDILARLSDELAISATEARRIEREVTSGTALRA